MRKEILKFLLILSLFTSTSWAVDISHIIVLKNARELQLWQGDSLYKSFDIKLSISYNNPLFKPTAKQREGDNQTPVGFYKISKKRQHTRFPKSLLISYPNWKDIHNAEVRGIPSNEIGGMILIHGNPYKPSKAVIKFAARLGIEKETVNRWARKYLYPFFDWTNGCVAVSDEEMNEIFSLVKKNTPINIYP